MTKTKERVYAERQDNYKQKKEVIFEEARKENKEKKTDKGLAREVETK